MTNIFTDLVPIWVSVLFLIVIPIPIFLIAFLAKKGALEVHKKSVFYSILGFYALYFLYVGLASINGLFDKVALPPTILKLSTLPLFAFLFGVVFNLAIYKTILQNTTLESLVKVHIFRLIGVFFIILTYYETLPKFFALIAGFGDMLTAIASIFVAKAISDNKKYAKKLTYLWNTFGLIDILFTAISAFVLTKISIDTGAMGVDMLAQFPFCFIPAFAPPTIIFLHVAIYKKLKKDFA
jgi:hypothetical protein